MGKIVAFGTIGYPIDEGGAFGLRHHDCVAIAFHEDISWASLSPVTAVRDPDSGFLAVSSAGPGIGVPPPIATAIQTVLRQHSPTGVSVRSNAQEGHISAEGASKVQPLSDWTLDVDISTAGICFRLSAALQMLEPSQLKTHQNYWSAKNGKAQRVEVSFIVDWVTRTALFRVPNKASESPASSAISSTRRTLLEEASISQSGDLYGVSDSGGMVEISEVGNSSRRAVVLTRCGSDRLSNGFLRGVPPGQVRFPRLCFNFLDFASIMGPVGTANMSSVFTGGNLGEVENDLRHEIPSQDILEAEITASIGAGGLGIRYHLALSAPEAGLPTSIEDRITLPWASLVLRYPGAYWLATRRDLIKQH